METDNYGRRSSFFKIVSPLFKSEISRELHAPIPPSPEVVLRRRIRNRNTMIVFGFLIMSFGMVIYFLKPFSFNDRNDIDGFDQMVLLNTLIAFILILIGIGMGLFVYLQNGSYEQISNTVIATVNESREATEVMATDIGTVPVRMESLVEDAGYTSRERRPEREFALDGEIERRIWIIQSDYRKIINRLVDEIERLGRVANYNLVFGSIATIAGVFILAWNAFEAPPKAETGSILVHYIPRLSTIIFIEIFAFFFLKIYKTNLSDIKYFHNERTNIEQKILSLKAAVMINDAGQLKTVIEELARTERNRILKKNETTVELERERTKLNIDKNVIDLLKSILDKKG